MASFFGCLLAVVQIVAVLRHSVTEQLLLTSSFIHLGTSRPVHARILVPRNGLAMQIVAALERPLELHVAATDHVPFHLFLKLVHFYK